jgi:hypothetical protein
MRENPCITVFRPLKESKPCPEHTEHKPTHLMGVAKNHAFNG